MAAEIDFRRPALVVVGHWNAAILNDPGWIAKNILAVPDGEEVKLESIMVTNQFDSIRAIAEKHIWLFENFGLACDGRRVEMFAHDIDHLDELYGATRKLTEILPHTPIDAVGVNFAVEATEDDVRAVASTLEIDDSLGAIGSQLAWSRSDSIEIPGEELPRIENSNLSTLRIILNLSQKTDFEVAEIELNYHAKLQDAGILTSYIEADPIGHWYRHAVGVLNETYGMDEVTKRSFFETRRSA